MKDLKEPTPLQEIAQADRQSLIELIDYYRSGKDCGSLFEAACSVRNRYYGKKVFFRGLIEFSSYCKNDCYYCGIRHSNLKAVRYRLSRDEILSCCQNGYSLGFRTFVLQSGEDPYYNDDRVVDLVRSIKADFPSCAVTLSLGEKSRESYQKYFDAGADRYLLRHETADEDHYAKLHPAQMSLKNRKQCLSDLKEIGYQVGAGFMVESPYQTTENLADDLLYLRDLQPHMVGIGPFIPHHDTIFKDCAKPDASLTLIMLALTRLILPKALIPATTALGTIDPEGREKGLRAGANVVMPNLSPVKNRKDYSLYDNKICTGEEAAECRYCLDRRILSAGFEPDLSRGDHTEFDSHRSE